MPLDHDIEASREVVGGVPILSHHAARFGVHRPYRTGKNGVCSISSNFNSNSNAEVYKWPKRFFNGKNVILHYNLAPFGDKKIDKSKKHSSSLTHFKIMFSL